MAIRAKTMTDTNMNESDWGHESWKLQRPERIIRRGKEIQRMLDEAEPPLIPVWVAVVIASVALLIIIIFIGWLYLMARRQWNLGTGPIRGKNEE